MNGIIIYFFSRITNNVENDGLQLSKKKIDKKHFNVDLPT